jgi:hypothetical protein
MLASKKNTHVLCSHYADDLNKGDVLHAIVIRHFLTTVDSIEKKLFGIFP